MTVNTADPVTDYDAVETPRLSTSSNGEMLNASSSSDELNTTSSRFWRFALGPPGVVVGAILGAILGISMQQGEVDPVTVSWVALPGDLFIRALKCLVSPLVFCSLVTGMADMFALGKASSIGWRTAALYTCTTVVASIEGLIWVTIFRGMFNSKPGKDTVIPKELAFKCSGGKYISVNDSTGSISCSSMNISSNSTFVAMDINNVFKVSSTPYVKLSLSESLQAQLKQMVPDNITSSFANANLLSIVMFAIPFGICLSLLPKKYTVVTSIFKEFNLIFMKMIQGAISITPIAVISLIAGSLAQQTDLVGVMKDVGTLVLTVSVGLIIHVLLFLPLFLYAFVRINPYNYMRFIYPAQIFALGCASSMATLPVTMKCVEATKQVSSILSNFVLSLGATINMDGSALYYPAAIVFMAETAGFGDRVGGVELFLIIVVSTVGSVGSAPVPAAGIVMTITIWNSVFPSIDLPNTFSYIVATDWLLDRFITATNVTGDTIIVRIVAQLTGEDTLERERQSLASVSQIDVESDYQISYKMQNPA